MTDFQEEVTEFQAKLHLVTDKNVRLILKAGWTKQAEGLLELWLDPITVSRYTLPEAIAVELDRAKQAETQTPFVRIADDRLQRAGESGRLMKDALNALKAEYHEAQATTTELRGELAALRGEFDSLRDRCQKMQQWLDQKAAEVQAAAPKRRVRKVKPDAREEQPTPQRRRKKVP